MDDAQYCVRYVQQVLTKGKGRDEKGRLGEKRGNEKRGEEGSREERRDTKDFV